jgi:hypothetical protein
MLLSSFCWRRIAGLVNDELKERPNPFQGTIAAENSPRTIPTEWVIDFFFIDFQFLCLSGCPLVNIT